MKPINDDMRNYGSNRGEGPKRKLTFIDIIVIVVILLLFFSNAGNNITPESSQTTPQGQNTNVVQNNSYNPNEGYDYSKPSEYASQDSINMFDLLFGTGYQASSAANTNFASYEDSTIKNVSKDKYTLMIYMCGSNLESDGGYASSDIEEMLKSTLADEVNVLIYTGGAKRWYDFGISNKSNQIYQIKDHKLNLIKNDLGLKSMAESDTLIEFLKYAKTNFKADKYALIFWDHGGGAVTGFGLDEVGSKANDTLTIDEIKSALNTFGERLEFVGFDACLMANVETAYALKESANYLVASEETEPGTGWDYIRIFNGLSKDSSQEGNVTGKTIVDSFIASNSSYRNPDATLSVIDLSKMDSLYKNLVSFMKEVKTQDFDKKNYNTFAKAIQNSKAFGDGALDTIDLIDFAGRINNKFSSTLVSSAKGAIAYNKTNQYVQNSNGLSIFIPNKKLNYFDRMLSIYKKIGFGQDYTDTLSKYVSVKAGGLNSTYTVNNYSYSQNSTDYSVYDWFDALLVGSMKSTYEKNKIDVKELKVENKDDYLVLKLSNDDWEKVTKVESVLWFDTGEGYLDMGVDSYFRKDDDGDLKVEFDGTWLAINGDNIVYEVIERTDDYEKGRVPCVINDERVNLILYFDKANPDGIVLGYQPDYDEEELIIFEKGLRKLRFGDKIDFVAKLYTYDGELKDEYYINDSIIVGQKPLMISYESLEEGDCLVYYKLTDIFENVYYTEPVIFED